MSSSLATLQMQAARILMCLYFLHVSLCAIAEISKLVASGGREDVDNLHVFETFILIGEALTLLPTLLLLVNKRMPYPGGDSQTKYLHPGVILAAVTCVDVLTMIVRVARGDRPFKHVILKKMALVGGFALLVQHTQMQVKEKERTSTGLLTPKAMPSCLSMDSTVLLLARLAISSYFLVAGMTEMLVAGRAYEGGKANLLQAHHDLEQKMAVTEEKIRALDAGQAALPVDLYTNFKCHSPLTIDRDSQEAQRMRLALNKMKYHDSGYVARLVEYDGAVLFWPQAVMGVLIAFGIGVNYIPLGLAGLLLVEGFDFMQYISMKPGTFFGWLDRNAIEMFADFSLVGCLILVGKLGGGKYSVDAFIAKKKA